MARRTMTRRDVDEVSKLFLQEDPLHDEPDEYERFLSHEQESLGGGGYRVIRKDLDLAEI